MPFIILAIAAVAALAFTATASAAPRRPADPEPDDDDGDGADAPPASLASQRFKAEAETIPGPFPLGALMKVAKGESGYAPGIVAADKVTGASELGACQLVTEHASNGTPNTASAQGAIGADVDPLTLRGAIWGAQVVYSQAKRRFAGDLAELGMSVPDDDDVEAWVSIMHSQHSIGRGAFKRLMRDAKAAGRRDPLAAFQYWADVKMPPKLGRMPGVLVRTRVKRLLKLPEDATAYAPLPDRIAALPSRPDNIPRFDADKAKRYILAERRRNGKPRQADGSPPGV